MDEAPIPEQVYPLTYKLEVHNPPLTRTQVTEDRNRGAGDAALLFSLVYPPDGSFKILMVSVDGRTGDELTDDEVFKVWAMAASRLGKSETLAPWKKEIAQTFFDTFAEIVRNGVPADKDGPRIIIPR